MSLFPPNAPIVFFWDRLEGISFCGEEAVADGLVRGSGTPKGLGFMCMCLNYGPRRLGGSYPVSWLFGSDMFSDSL
jgi:hypothetical protein